VAGTGRREGRGVCSTFEMAEELAHDLTLRDDGDEPQHPTLAPRAGGQLQAKDPPQEPRPRLIRGSRLRCLAIHPLLAWCGDDAPAYMAVRRQAPPIAHEMDVWQGDQRRQLLQECQR